MADRVNTTDQVTTPDPTEADRATDGSGGRLDQARERLYEAARNVQERVGHMSSEAQRGAARASATIKGTTRERYEVAAEKLEQGYGRVSRDVRQRGTELDRFVRESPGKALLLAAGAGFLVGLIFRQR